MPHEPKDSEELGEALRRAKDDHPDPIAKKMLAGVRKALTGAEAEPVTIDRFEVLETLGSGGMGVVYATYDPKLDRKVALKVLHAGGENANRRVLREARVLAKLAHPNIVAIYDAETVGDDIFIAMEYVEGQNLRQWIEDGDRSVAETIELLVAAGNGLAAAHDAGIVHGDFKPENVVIGNDGRARVVDFGMARSDIAADDAVEAPKRDVAAADMNQTVSRGGTPAYMAPEQWSGDPARARSDQFAFCITAYEALFGVRPFVGTSVSELAAAVCAGDVRFPSDGAEIPDTVKVALRRGLAVDVEKRYPVMNQLLAVFAPNPRRGVSRTMVAVMIAALLVVVGVLVLVAKPYEPDACGAGEERLASVWNPARRAAVESKFAAGKLPFAGDAFARTAGKLDSFGSDFVAGYRNACEANRDGRESDALLDLRMHCLDRHLGQMLALVSGIEGSHDPDLAEQALKAARALGDLEVCGDAERLTAATPLPTDPALREKVERTWKALDDAAAAYHLGDYKKAQELAEPVSTADVGTAYPLVRARALHILGRAQSGDGKQKKAEATFRAGLPVAAEAHADRITGFLWIRLLRSIHNQARYDEVHELAGLARPAVTRAGLPQAHIDTVVGRAFKAQGNYEPALKAHRAALSEYRRSGKSGDVGGALNDIANVLWTMARYEEAEKLIKQALAIKIENLGANHPEVATNLDNLGLSLLAAGRLRESEEQHRQALEVRKKGLGADHEDTATTHNNLGVALYQQGKYDAAEAEHKAALAIREKVLRKNHPRIASSLNNLGAVEISRGNHDAALSYFKRSLVIREAKRKDHPAISGPLANIALIYQAQGKVEEARAALLRGRAAVVAAAGVTHPRVLIIDNSLGSLLMSEKKYRAAVDHYREVVARAEKTRGKSAGTGDAWAGLGRALVETGQAKKGVAPLQRALTIRQAAEGDKSYLAEVQFDLARALWKSGANRGRARSLATAAQAIYAANVSKKLEADKVTRWLESLR